MEEKSLYRFPTLAAQNMTHSLSPVLQVHRGVNEEIPQTRYHYSISYCVVKWEGVMPDLSHALAYAMLQQQS